MMIGLCGSEVFGRKKGEGNPFLSHRVNCQHIKIESVCELTQTGAVAIYSLVAPSQSSFGDCKAAPEGTGPFQI